MLVEADITCPYCFEVYQTMIDTSQGDHTTIEDCAVCCRPIQLRVRCEPGEVMNIDVSTC
jgi:predicted DsbA family dithiol-disulfide isomerase